MIKGEFKRVLITGGSGFIGTNLIEMATRQHLALLNVDTRPPLNEEHGSVWRRCDILNLGNLKDVFECFLPECVIHLAARTDVVEGTTVERDYRVNTEGTQNLLSVVRAAQGVRRVIITSTQYVHRPGHIPTSDEDYEPHTVYGQSKAQMEEIVRRTAIGCTWTIVRPTNIWGPWHMRHRKELYPILRKGLLVRPRRVHNVVSYGYVENVAYQMLRILELPADMVHRQTLYVGDRPILQNEWVNAFSRMLLGRDAYAIPLWIMRSAALVGDLASRILQRPCLLTTTRLNNMMTDYLVPMEQTFQLLGASPFSLQEGVERTVAWLDACDARKCKPGLVQK